MVRKRWAKATALVCLAGMLFCGCGKEEEKNTVLPQKQGTVTYQETDFIVLPDESIIAEYGVRFIRFPTSYGETTGSCMFCCRWNGRR